MKKILFYSWDELVEGKNRGGGVTIYLKNLIRKLIDTNQFDIYYLASGREYDLDRSDIYIKKTDNCFSGGCKSYAITNSPCIAPANLNFNNISEAIHNKKLVRVIDGFIEECGGFDIIHFHNLEGISIDVLDLKEKYVDTMFIYSLHNYYPFCPQVNLWAKSTINCYGHERYFSCTKCMPTDINVEKIKKKLALNQKLEKTKNDEEKNKIEEKIKALDKEYELIKNETDLVKLKKDIEEYKKNSVLKINNIDYILAVSDRTREIAVNYGVNENKIETNYIGTEISEYQCEVPRKRIEKEFIKIIYMGKMRKEKGFYFLLDTLEEIDDELASRMEVVFATQKKDKDAVLRIEEQNERYRKIEIIDGYKHEELRDILVDVDLGIVPVLWEDNLPQVAIEMTAFGVPVLSTGLGGTKELCACNPNFIFDLDDKKQFIEKIKSFCDIPSKLDDYWENYRGALTMREHIKELINKYYG